MWVAMYFCSPSPSSTVVDLTRVLAAEGGFVADGCDPGSAVTRTVGLVQVDLESVDARAEAVVVLELHAAKSRCVTNKEQNAESALQSRETDVGTVPHRYKSQHGKMWRETCRFTTNEQRAKI